MPKVKQTLLRLFFAIKQLSCPIMEPKQNLTHSKEVELIESPIMHNITKTNIAHISSYTRLNDSSKNLTGTN